MIPNNGKKITIGTPRRISLLNHQDGHDFLLISRFAKKPANKKNKGIRQMCMNSKTNRSVVDDSRSAGHKISIPDM